MTKIDRSSFLCQVPAARALQGHRHAARAPGLPRDGVRRHPRAAGAREPRQRPRLHAGLSAAGRVEPLRPALRPRRHRRGDGRARDAGGARALAGVHQRERAARRARRALHEPDRQAPAQRGLQHERDEPRRRRRRRQRGRRRRAPAGCARLGLGRRARHLRRRVRAGRGARGRARRGGLRRRAPLRGRHGGPLRARLPHGPAGREPERRDPGEPVVRGRRLQRLRDADRGRGARHGPARARGGARGVADGRAGAVGRGRGPVWPAFVRGHGRPGEQRRDCRDGLVHRRVF